jgi:hypothetical protein
MTLNSTRVSFAFLTVAVLTAAKCGGDAASSGSSAGATKADAPPSHTATVKSQSAQRDPCSWITRAAAQKAVGDSVIAEPARVRSAENPVPQPNGDACAYQLAPQGSIAQQIAIELTPDESGAMQTAFGNMGNVEDELKGGNREAKHDTLIDGRWDFVSEIPGGLTAARAGRIAVQFVTPIGKSAKGLALAGAMLDQIADIPFTNDPADPATPAHVPDPCALITRDEAEKVLGKLAVAPYPASKGSALVYGSGASCAYYTGKHRALVITPTLRHGAEMFQMMGGVNAQVAAKTGGTQAPDTLEGAWDALSLGPDGALHLLKGDKMLTVQYKTSGASFDETIALVRAAVARL